MQQTIHQISDPSAAATLIEKVLSRKCKLHRTFPCEFIHIKPTEFSPRLCCQCVEDQNVPSSEYVSIRYLLQASSRTTFKAYPKFNENSIILKLQEFKDSNEKVSEELSAFFNHLSSTVSIAIEKQKFAQKEKLAYLSSCYQGIYDTLEDISQIGKFQELVNKDNEELLKRFINDQYNQSNSYTQTINSKLSVYQKIYSSFSLTDSKDKLEQIIKLINSLEFFPTNLQSQTNQSQQQQQQQQQQQNLIQSNQKQSPQPSKNNLQQQGQQIQQLKLESSSQEVFNQYQSLIQKGIKNGVVVSRWWWVERVSESRWWVRRSRSYASTYQEWKSFSENERLEQLRILKEELKISI